MGLGVAVRMIRDRGVVTPTVVALTRAPSGWTGLWEMDITQAVQRGKDGLEEMGFILTKLVSKDGCDLSLMGVRPEHFKADAVVLVVEGMASGMNPSGEDVEWRSLSLELKTSGQMVAMLYKVNQTGAETSLEMVGRAVSESSPLHGVTRALH